MLTGSHDLIRQINRFHILNAIRRQPFVSRTELASQLGLAQGTVSGIVGDLVGEGMLFERLEKTGDPAGGRPRRQLELNPNIAYVVGAYVSPPSGEVTAEVANLRGDRLARTSQRVPPLVGDAGAFADAVAATVSAAVRESGLALMSIHSVGVGVPAVVETHSGVLHWLPGLFESPAPLAKLLSARLGRPVIIDNTAHLAARAERWFGDGREIDDFAVVLVGHGIGIGQYVGGALWLGGHGLGPEIGHTKVGLEPDALCGCGARGCLSAFASGFAIFKRAQEALGDVALSGQDHQLSLDAYAREAAAGHPVLAPIFEQAGRGLGLALANLITVTGPEHIIVVFASEDLDAALRRPLQQAIIEATPRFLRGRTSVAFKLSQAVEGAKGAAALALERIYRTPLEPEHLPPG